MIAETKDLEDAIAWLVSQKGGHGPTWADGAAGWNARLDRIIGWISPKAPDPTQPNTTNQDPFEEHEG